MVVGDVNGGFRKQVLLFLLIDGLLGLAIQKGMSAVKVAFKILEDDDKPPIGS